ncbi:hypothetical protein DUNSADRAFT_7784 [Dunaliella salina]|uniref:Uncharacterized protein n=1 Tax=Dunaliella salina TaxID=3046 RepID=A0ABQ7GKQ8_DUNSA|nr:hypothetical protein DUNSADRAFT_7784 [Dunaliella salina]|eukprot:KAF5835194.1 hypothetical protein DUNSADRAFT_7784 [Dunaliella salina]
MRRSDRLRCAATSTARSSLMHLTPSTSHTNHQHSSHVSEVHGIAQVGAAAGNQAQSSVNPSPNPTATAGLPPKDTAGVQEWSGLSEWRARGVDLGRGWGRKGPTADVRAPGADEWEGVPLAGSLVECALQVLNTASPTGKAALTHRAWLAYNQGRLPLMPRQTFQPSQAMSASPAPAAGADANKTTAPFSFPSSAAAAGANTATTTAPSSVPSAAPSTSPLSSSSLSWPLPSPSSAAGTDTRTSGLARVGPAASCGFRPCAVVPTPPIRPARPARPVLVVPKLVPSFERGESPMTSGAAHMLHNLAHIELNAVDLAWDTVARFANGPIGAALPDLFFSDFARVADDESRHLGWCLQRLEELGHAYGDMPAHNLLWEGAQASSDDLSARLAVVPMSQEARGLDAGQRLVSRLIGSQDKRSAAIVERISQEERAHVAVGIAWFKRVCLAMGVEVPDIFRAHVSELCPELLKGPFHHAARQEVGLKRDMYDITSWPEAAAKAIMPPTEAAWLRGRGGQVRRRQAMGGMLLPLQQQQLQQPLQQQQEAMDNSSMLIPLQQQQSQQPQQHHHHHHHHNAGSELTGPGSTSSCAGGQQGGTDRTPGISVDVHQQEDKQSDKQGWQGSPDEGRVQVGADASCFAPVRHQDSQQGSWDGLAASGSGCDRSVHGWGSQLGNGSGPAALGSGCGRSEHGGQDKRSGHAGLGEGGVNTDGPATTVHGSQVIDNNPPVICGLVPEGQGNQALRALHARLAVMLEVDGLMAY